jgi:hypothetical protein
VLECAGQFLDGEYHAGQRRIERRGDAGAAAGEDEARDLLGVAEAEATAQPVHQAGADVHRRALAPDRGAAEQREQRQRHFADCHGQCEHTMAQRRIFHFDCRDHLRDAAALGWPEYAARQPGQ